MTIRQFWENCKNNWHIKIICLVVAIFIFFFYKNTTLVSRTIIVPLEVSSQGSMVPASPHQGQVKVTLKGEPDQISRIIESDVSAILNIDYFTQPGVYEIPVQVNLADSVMVLEPLEVRTSPSVVSMEIATRAYAQIPVTVNLQGTPANGYEVKEVNVRPSTLGVMGPKPVLESITELVTETVALDDKTVSFSEDVAVLNNNKLISIQDKPLVEVDVTINAIQMDKTFQEQTVYLYGLNPMYVAQFTPSSVTFSLSGTQRALQNYTPELYTVRADCSGIDAPGEYELPVTITLPSGTRLVSQSARTVNVTITAVVQDEIKDSETDTFGGIQ